MTKLQKTIKKSISLWQGFVRILFNGLAMSRNDRKGLMADRFY